MCTIRVVEVSLLLLVLLLKRSGLVREGEGLACSAVAAMLSTSCGRKTEMKADN